jgi:hypothetical protein
MTCNQIWLIPIVDDRQCGYITKLEKKKNKKKKLSESVFILNE